MAEDVKEYSVKEVQDVVNKLMTPSVRKLFDDEHINEEEFLPVIYQVNPMLENESLEQYAARCLEMVVSMRLEKENEDLLEESPESNYFKRALRGDGKTLKESMGDKISTASQKEDGTIDFPENDAERKIIMGILGSPLIMLDMLSKHLEGEEAKRAGEIEGKINEIIQKLQEGIKENLEKMNGIESTVPKDITLSDVSALSRQDIIKNYLDRTPEEFEAQLDSVGKETELKDGTKTVLFNDPMEALNIFSRYKDVLGRNASIASAHSENVANLINDVLKNKEQLVKEGKYTEEEIDFLSKACDSVLGKKGSLKMIHGYEFRKDDDVMANPLFASFEAISRELDLCDPTENIINVSMGTVVPGMRLSLEEYARLNALYKEQKGQDHPGYMKALPKMLEANKKRDDVSKTPDEIADLIERYSKGENIDLLDKLNDPKELVVRAQHLVINTWDQGKRTKDLRAEGYKIRPMSDLKDKLDEANIFDVSLQLAKAIEDIRNGRLVNPGLLSKISERYTELSKEVYPGIEETLIDNAKNYIANKEELMAKGMSEEAFEKLGKFVEGHKQSLEGIGEPEVETPEADKDKPKTLEESLTKEEKDLLNNFDKTNKNGSRTAYMLGLKFGPSSEFGKELLSYGVEEVTINGMIRDVASTFDNHETEEILTAGLAEQLVKARAGRIINGLPHRNINLLKEEEDRKNKKEDAGKGKAEEPSVEVITQLGDVIKFPFQTVKAILTGKSLEEVIKDEKTKNYVQARVILGYRDILGDSMDMDALAEAEALRKSYHVSENFTLGSSSNTHNKDTRNDTSKDDISRDDVSSDEPDIITESSGDTEVTLEEPDVPVEEHPEDEVNTHAPEEPGVEVEPKTENSGKEFDRNSEDYQKLLADLKNRSLKGEDVEKFVAENDIPVENGKTKMIQLLEIMAEDMKAEMEDREAGNGNLDVKVAKEASEDGKKPLNPVKLDILTKLTEEATQNGLGEMNGLQFVAIIKKTLGRESELTDQERATITQLTQWDVEEEKTRGEERTLPGEK